MALLLPRAGAPITEGGGPPTREHYRWCVLVTEAINTGQLTGADAAAAIAAIATALGSPDGTVAGIPADADSGLPLDTLALGLRSVRHYGSLADGRVSFDLLGDEDAPGNTYAYGTTGDGTKGWRSIASAFTASTGNVTLTTGANGVTDVDLADLANAGGGTLQKTARDAKGRLAGTSAATTTDLPEGTNLYHTDARVDARIALAGSSGVPYEVADGTTYTVPSGTQALFTLPIELIGSAALDVSGALVEVA